MKTNTSAREALYEHADECGACAENESAYGEKARADNYRRMEHILKIVARIGDDDMCEVVAQTWEKGQ